MTHRTILTAAMAAMLASAAPASASDNAPVDENGRDRINFANRLGMLAERIPAAACADAAGIAPLQAGPVLAITSKNFDRILAALEHGDAAMAIVAPEDDRRIIEDIEAVRSIWAPLAPAVDAVVDGPAPDQAAAIRAAAPDLLDRAERLTSRIAGHYADPSQLLQRDALAIEIAGRQRMLLQRIALDACIAAGGDAGARATLAEAHDLFDISLAALRTGLPEAGVSKPPNAVVAADLDAIAADWAEISPVIARLADGAALSQDEHGRIYTEMGRLLGLMNTAVGRYVKASRLNL